MKLEMNPSIIRVGRNEVSTDHLVQFNSTRCPQSRAQSGTPWCKQLGHSWIHRYFQMTWSPQRQTCNRVQKAEREGGLQSRPTNAKIIYSQVMIHKAGVKCDSS